MTTKGKLLSATGLVIAGSVALAIGVPLSTLLFVGISLLCPAAMFFGMHNSGACGHQHKRVQNGHAVPETSTTSLDTQRDGA